MPEAPEREFAAFAYGESRSGETVYYSVVMTRDDLDSTIPELRVVQSFLFLPTEEQPLGELNRPHSVHRDRVHPLDSVNVRWDLYPDGLRERLPAVLAAAAEQDR